jgi:hypothetical protein
MFRLDYNGDDPLDDQVNSHDVQHPDRDKGSEDQVNSHESSRVLGFTFT